MTSVEVSALTIYPVKSCRGIAVTDMSLGTIGPEWDRRWMLIDRHNKFISQRQYPAMCLISTHVDNGILRLTAKDMKDVYVNAPLAQAALTVNLWDEAVSVLDCGDEAAQWLAEVLAIDCRLVFMPDSCRRLVDPEYARNSDLVSFSDGFPLLLISEESLLELNNHLPAPVEMNRFRPNIVVRGCDAFAEDSWKILRIGDVRMSVVKPCSRCVMPSIDQQTAKRDSAVLHALAAFRRKNGAVYFGQNLIHHQPGQITKGDRVEILC